MKNPNVVTIGPELYAEGPITFVAPENMGVIEAAEIAQAVAQEWYTQRGEFVFRAAMLKLGFIEAGYRNLDPAPPPPGLIRCPECREQSWIITEEITKSRGCTGQNWDEWGEGDTDHVDVVCGPCGHEASDNDTSRIVAHANYQDRLTAIRQALEVTE